MIMGSRFTIPLVLCGVACVPLDDALEPGEEHRVEIDSAFTRAERDELNGCSTSWRTLSHGQVDVVFVDERGAFALRREGPSQGGYVRRERRAWIDAGRLYADGFDARSGVRAMCMNLIGQFFRVDLHDRRGALSRDDVVPYFTDPDRVACEAAGVCRPKDSR